MSSRVKSSTKVASKDARNKKASPGGGLGWTTWLGLAAVVVLCILWYFLPIAQWTESLRSWVKSLGVLGILTFAAIHLVATVLLVPGAALTIAAGVVYGFWAFPLVVATATVSASLAFLIGRYIARDSVKALVRKKPVYRAIDDAITEDGWKIVGLVRLSPLVPFGLQNYLFGTTEVTFAGYAAATFFGIMPGTLVYVWLGTLGGATNEHKTGPGEWALLGLGFAATVVVSILVGRKAQQKLNKSGGKS